MTLQEFLEKTDFAIEVTDKLLSVSKDPVMVGIKSQLEAILASIKKNEPSLDLANSLTMANAIVHSYSPPPTADLDRWANTVLAINHIYKRWSSE